jgi:hypothetical protein
MFKHMRELGMPSSFVTTCEQLYGVSNTKYITPHGNTLHIEDNRGPLQVRLGIDDVIRTISMYFVVFSETTNAKYGRNHNEMYMKNIDDTIDP